MTNQAWDLVPDSFKEKMQWERLPPEVRDAIAEYGMWFFEAGRSVTGDIEEIRYDGRLIILDDGTRWKVDSIDADMADLWSPYTKVVVIDGEMFNLDGVESLAVEEEHD